MATTVAPSVSPSPSTLSSPSSPSTPSYAHSPPSVSVHQNDHQPHHSKLDHQPKPVSPPKQSEDLPMTSNEEKETTANNSPEASKNGAGLAVTNAPVRPPPKPFRRANLSLEQNPFEVSFSQSSSSNVRPGSPRANNNAGSNVNGNSNANSENDTSNHSRNPSDAGANNPGGQKTSPKPTLPPLSSIDGPTRESGPGFPWGFSAALNDTGSLRSGPLSPAMLPGPRQDGSTAAAGGAGSHGTSHGYFDAPSLAFRTGLTPGIGRTGLTPLVGGPASFPPPSPNTAAFLAMVTNPGGATGQQVSQLTGGATITPNTLSALTGTLMQHVNATSGTDSTANANGAAANPSTAGQAQNGAAGANANQAGAHPLAVSHTFGAQNPVTNGAYSQTGASEPGGFRPPMDSYSGAAQNAAAAAANGLFLLSQAHQELTKREEQQQAQAAAQAEAAAQAANSARGAAPRRGSTMASTASTNNAAGNGHNKRKSGDVTAPTQAARPSGGKRARGSTAGSTAVATSPTQPTRQSSRRKKTDVVSYSGPEVDSPEQDEMSVDEDDIENMLAEGDAMAPTPIPGAPGRAGQKKFETEEEKRRNFLERNRQAALKCRQRKKAWLTQLQQQVEYLKTENERLQGTIVSMRDEVTRLSAVVVAHRACGLGGVVVPGYAAANLDPHHGPSHHGPHSDRTASPSSPVVGVAPVSVPVSVPPPPAQASAQAAQASQGYGY
ncbi:hypothetical protein FS837_012841 [Tulasnella sp. UAMH 9824]|nr:hypothetical protein FS837_012841 [Tulasnella sp. UAMH 9824]